MPVYIQIKRGKKTPRPAARSSKLIGAIEGDLPAFNEAEEGAGLVLEAAEFHEFPFNLFTLNRNHEAESKGLYRLNLIAFSFKIQLIFSSL